jgi:hypothetical protein
VPRRSGSLIPAFVRVASHGCRAFDSWWYSAQGVGFPLWAAGASVLYTRRESCDIRWRIPAWSQHAPGYTLLVELQPMDYWYNCAYLQFEAPNRPVQHSIRLQAATLRPDTDAVFDGAAAGRLSCYICLQHGTAKLAPPHAAGNEQPKCLS